MKNFFWYFFTLIFIFLLIVFYTLMEQKLMSLSHYRLGPNKNSFLGILQPFMDSIKLFSKKFLMVFSINYFQFILLIFLGFLLNFFLWMFMVQNNNLIINVSYSFLFIIFFMSLEIIYSIFLGWMSSSIYSEMGSFRSTVQIMSFEMNMYFIMIYFIFLYKNMNLNMIFFMKKKLYLFLFQLYIFFFLFIMLLLECNRSPFDLVEAESELVSGSNTDLKSCLLSFFFMIEYSLIIFMSFFFSYLFMSNTIMKMILMILLLYLVLLIRLIYPRILYFKMLNFFWKKMFFLFLMNLFILTFLM